MFVFFFLTGKDPRIRCPAWKAAGIVGLPALEDKAPVSPFSSLGTCGVDGGAGFADQSIFVGFCWALLI